MIDIVLVFALLATGITANKILLYAVSPELLVALRMLAGSAILFVYSLKNKAHRLSWCKVKSTLLVVLLISICSTFLPSVLKAYALKFMKSYKAAFFGSLDPFITAVYAYVLFGEILNWQKIIGLLIAFTGSLVMLQAHAPKELAFKMIGFVSYPEFAALGAVVVSRLGWMLSQRMLKKEVYTPVQISMQIMFFGGMSSLVSYIIQAFYRNQTYFYPEKLSSLYLFNFPIIQYLGVYGLFIGALVYTVFAGNVIAYNLYAKMLKKHSATLVSLVGFSVPIFVALYGYILLNERLTREFFMSVVITFIGFVVFSSSYYKQKK